ncbi:hypothetical protein Taro_036441 [Colocasia esculenta]|uniref:RING-type E3 ubiquitin transferase n=1 Tax=Colocasia esculenta TaxID=4460 RepID=A0A843W8F9_COLES|nr:hypothetical protein [Colocasia esculenta]
MADSSTSTASSEPLLRPAAATEQPRTSPLAALLGRAGGRRGAPALVRETAARQLDERRADWGYSRPVVALDVAWNLGFAVASAAVLASTLRERPNVPIRLWVAGYALQCVVHVALVLAEYRRRSRRRRGVEDGAQDSSDSEGNDSEEEEEDDGGDIGGGGRNRRSRMAKHCESLNTVVSFIWWIVGFYWVVTGGDNLCQNAPTLYCDLLRRRCDADGSGSSSSGESSSGPQAAAEPYLVASSWARRGRDWGDGGRLAKGGRGGGGLAVIFLAFDVFFAIFCVALACVIGIALCCCLPCIIAILYAVAGQEGASDADISILSRYKFVQSGIDDKTADAGSGRMVPIGNNTGDSTYERMLLLEDAECCICLTTYEDGADLHSLPCNHHFHSACISKWLRINATCPLCKYNILKGNE